MRSPNALAVAEDGSVWFGEQSVPGIGHLYQNGSLVEYAWPGGTSNSTATGACGFKTSIWGVAIWNGLLWGTDGDGNRIIGLDPSTDTFQAIAVPASQAFPYSLAVGPDDSLWFTLLAGPPRLGRIDVQGHVQLYQVQGDSKDIPADISFQNSTTGYFVGIEPEAGNGSVYRFDPSPTSSDISAVKIGGGYSLYAPNSISADRTTVWVTQHGAASIAGYSLRNRTWSVYPTSTENYTSTTLPYFVRANGSSVWFNEHYGNRMAVIDTQSSTLTEYSLSKPAVTSGSQLDNALTISLGSDRTWFAEVTANYVGFVSARYQPAFGLRVTGNTTFTLNRGASESVRLVMTGQSQGPIQLKFSDSESPTSALKLIGVTPQPTSIAALVGERIFAFTISAGSTLSPGDYTLVITATDGLVSRSVFVYLRVT